MKPNQNKAKLQLKKKIIAPLSSVEIAMVAGGRAEENNMTNRICPSHECTTPSRCCIYTDALTLALINL